MAAAPPRCREGATGTLTQFCRHFLLNETVHFVQNDVVSSTVSNKKKKSPKRCRFERHCGSFCSPGRARQGKKKILFHCFSLLLLSLNALKRRRQRPSTCLSFDPWLPQGEKQRGCAPQAVLGRLHSVRPDHLTTMP